MSQLVHKGYAETANPKEQEEMRIMAINVFLKKVFPGTSLWSNLEQAQVAFLVNIIAAHRLNCINEGDNFKDVMICAETIIGRTNSIMIGSGDYDQACAWLDLLLTNVRNMLHKDESNGIECLYVNKMDFEVYSRQYSIEVFGVDPKEYTLN